MAQARKEWRAGIYPPLSGDYFIVLIPISPIQLKNFNTSRNKQKNNIPHDIWRCAWRAGLTLVVLFFRLSLFIVFITLN
ncbi:hypothetical protein [Kosakonia sacchari]